MAVSPRAWWRGRREGGGRSAVIVPVPEAEPALEAWGLPRTGLGTPAGMPPHVTLLYPFVPAARLDDADVDALRRIVVSACAFSFSLGDVGRFRGVLYLAPDPAAPFTALTRAIAHRWPEHPPYEGAYAEFVPHLTVIQGREPASLARRIRDTLPLRAYASEAWLMVQRGDDRWRLHARCALGRAPAR